MKDLRRFLYIIAGINTIKKRQVNYMQLEFETDNNKEYKFDGIWDSAIYAWESERQLSELYYLVS